MNKIFYFLMVFFAFSAVQVGAQDGKGTAGAPGFKVDGANMMGDAICPEGGCDSARGTEKSRDMKGDLDNSGAAMPHTLVRPMDGTGVAPIVAPGMVTWYGSTWYGSNGRTSLRTWADYDTGCRLQRYVTIVGFLAG
jgi:hypothetical protein